MVQYVVETANELHIHIYLHRRGKAGCPHITEHFNSCCKSKFYSIQIIEVLSGNDHDRNSNVDENNHRLRLVRERFLDENIKDQFSIWTK